MELSELSQHWQDYQAEQERERQARKAEMAGRAEKNRRNAIIQRNAKRVGEIALGLTDVIGWSEDDSNRYAALSLARQSNLVPLGQLDDTDGTHAFARVYVKHMKDIEPVVVSRRIRKPKTASLVVPGETLEVGVRFYAGKEDGKSVELFATKAWSRSDEDSQETLDAVEHELTELSEKLEHKESGE